MQRLAEGDTFCLDTNVLMTPAYYPALNAFLDHLEKAGAYFRVSAVQRAELQKHRNGSDREKGALASKAMHWLTEGTQRQVVVFDDAPRGSRVSTYLDDPLVMQVAAHLRATHGTRRAVIVTDDVELTGRLQSLPRKTSRPADAVVVLDGAMFVAVMDAPR